MKYLKRLVFIALFAFSALFLASCGGVGSSDNGVYVFEPTSEEILEMVEKETGTNSAANLFVDQLKIKLVLEIKDNTGTMSASVSIFGKDQEKTVDLKVDQKNKIIWSEEDSEKKIKYKIEGDVLMLENPKLDIGDKNMATFLKSVKFKRASSLTSKGGTSKDSNSKSSTSQSFIANDNGKYVYNADKEKIESILKEQGATDEQLEQVAGQISLTMTIEIKDKEAKMTIEMNALGDNQKKSFDLKADQNGKTLESAEGGNDKVKYKIDGDVLTLDLSKFEAEDSETFAFFKDVNFKRQK